MQHLTRTAQRAAAQQLPRAPLFHASRAARKANTWVDTTAESGFTKKDPSVTLGRSTDFVHSHAVAPEPNTGAILTPIYASTTFTQESVEKYLEKGYSYSRTNNPTVKVLEDKMAILENGGGAVCTGTGMAATTLVMSAFLKSGDHCVITECSYGGTNRIARVQFKEHYDIDFSFVDFTDVETIRKACIPGKTKLIFSETPANPVLSLVDLEAVSALAKEIGAVHVCDATFATPVILRPLEFGCDLTLQSMTKFYCGHNIGTGGGVVAKNPEHFERLKLAQNMHGNIMAPQVAFNMLQTMKTMPLRVKQQSQNAMRIAQWLEAHPKVTKVVYPGLSHPQKELADKYHCADYDVAGSRHYGEEKLHGGMLYFELSEDLPGGSIQASVRLMNAIQRPWSLCENLGQVESIITACAVMTHANMLPEDRKKVGITDGFIRVSTGIEDVQDLLLALEKALAVA